MPKPIDLTGKKFGRLSVIGRVSNNKDGRTMWKCRCDCGNERIIMGKSLRSGHTPTDITIAHNMVNVPLIGLMLTVIMNHLIADGLVCPFNPKTEEM